MQKFWCKNIPVELEYFSIVIRCDMAKVILIFLLWKQEREWYPVLKENHFGEIPKQKMENFKQFQLKIKQT